MSGFEIEGYILSGTLVVSFLVKTAKWILEELTSLVPIYRQFKATIRGELPAQLMSASVDTRSERVSDLAVRNNAE